jgi:Sulfotransferase family
VTGLPPHVQSSALVLDNVKLVYVPVPKAGSTAMLWALLELVELEPEDFLMSTKLEVTRSLTVHDLTIWRKDQLAHARSRRALFESDDWLTFTLIREPVRRLWSAWVSKVLVRDPRFVAAYGDESWFPEPPESADDVVRSFRFFVEVLVDRPAEWHDPHWSSQADLVGIGELHYDVVARVEQLPGDLDPVAAHLRERGRGALRLRRENASLVAFVPEILDRETWERCAAYTASDRRVFGYEAIALAEGDPGEDWVAQVEASLPAIRAVIERNERIGDMKRLVTRTRRAS